MPRVVRKVVLEIIPLKLPIEKLYIELLKSLSTEEDNKSAELSPKLHHHNAYEIMLTLEADSDVFLKDSWYPMVSKQIIIIPPYTVHKVFYHIGTQYHRYLLQFERNFMTELLDAVDGGYILSDLIRSDFPIFTFDPMSFRKVSALFAELLKAFADCCQLDAKNPTVRMRLALASLLLEVHDLFVTKSITKTDRASSQLIKDVIQYIDANYMNRITIDRIAEALFVSKYYLCHRFKEATGESIIEFLQHTRIAKAQKFLTEEGCSITETCFHCGFNSVQHFYSVFKKLTNSTPRKFMMAEKR